MQDTDKNSTSSELSGAGNPLIMLSNARSSTKCGTTKKPSQRKPSSSYAHSNCSGRHHCFCNCEQRSSCKRNVGFNYQSYRSCMCCLGKRVSLPGAVEELPLYGAIPRPRTSVLPYWRKWLQRVQVSPSSIHLFRRALRKGAIETENASTLNVMTLA